MIKLREELTSRREAGAEQCEGAEIWKRQHSKPYKQVDTGLKIVPRKVYFDYWRLPIDIWRLWNFSTLRVF